MAPNCSVFETNSSQFSECELVANYINSFPSAFSNLKDPFPVSINVMYLGLFAFIFFVTTLLHWREWTDLLHSLTYFLALPTGYLLLPIYSAANLNKQDWGTREERNKEDQGLLGPAKNAWSALIRLCHKKDQHPQIIGEINIQ